MDTSMLPSGFFDRFQYLRPGLDPKVPRIPVRCVAKVIHHFETLMATVVL